METRNERLQWVHGLITVVMIVQVGDLAAKGAASMGPRSDNRGYARRSPACPARHGPLQWVHGLITVVMANATITRNLIFGLQWVHGLITVVMCSSTSCMWPIANSFNGSTV